MAQSSPGITPITRLMMAPLSYPGSLPLDISTPQLFLTAGFTLRVVTVREGYLVIFSMREPIITGLSALSQQIAPASILGGKALVWRFLIPFCMSLAELVSLFRVRKIVQCYTLAMNTIATV